jgi:D-3-phosphoglycerate dehydrogenase
VLATVLDAIKSEHINVQEMENIVFEGAEAAVARINLDKAPSQAILDGLRAGSTDVIELSVLKIS